MIRVASTCAQGWHRAEVLALSINKNLATMLRDVELWTCMPSVMGHGVTERTVVESRKNTTEDASLRLACSTKD
jgi:hypothetical protein